MLYWLSFADKNKFLGVCILEASNKFHAHELSFKKGLNPGGEVSILEIPEQLEDQIPDHILDRLLAEDEALTLATGLTLHPFVTE